MDGPSLPRPGSGSSVSPASLVSLTPATQPVRRERPPWVNPTALFSRFSRWWTRSAFTARALPTSEEPAGAKAVAVIVLLVVAGLLFFARLESPLLEPEDAVYAEVPRQMFLSGNWLVPLRHGTPYYEKPPLFFWLVMGSYTVCGVQDWAARIIPCAAALATVLVTFWWGTRTLGLRAGLAGALMLCLSARFVHQARMITMDGLLALWVTAALALGQQALHGVRLRRGWWLLSAAACGLGLLTKGPVALVLVMVPLLAYQLLDRRTARPSWSSWLAFGATAFGLALPWYLAMSWQDPAFCREFFWTHHVDMRFVHVLHPQPIWYYVPAILLGMLPWTLLVPGLIALLSRRAEAAADKPPREVGFLLLCGLWCLLFFSAASCKRIGYILPAMPAFALALGYTLDRRLPGSSLRFLCRGRRGSLASWATYGVLAGGVLCAVGACVSELAEPADCLPLVAVALAALIWQVYRDCSSQAGRTLGLTGSWAGCGATTFAVLFLTIELFLPAYYRRFSLRAEILALKEAAADPRIPVICHPHQCDSVSFYLGRDDIRSYSREQRDDLIADLQHWPETVVFVKTGRVLDTFREALPESWEFVPYGRSSWITAGVVRRRMGGSVRVSTRNATAPADQVPTGAALPVLPARDRPCRDGSGRAPHGDDHAARRGRPDRGHGSAVPGHDGGAAAALHRRESHGQ